MNLNGVELPAGYNGVGLHDSPGSNAGPQSWDEAVAHAQELKAHGVTVYKLLTENGSGDLHRARAYVEAGILPIVRWYVERPWGRGNYHWVTPGDQVRPYYEAGVRLIEPGWNEFNIACEWQGDRIPGAAQIAVEAVNAWEVGLGLQSQFPGLKVLFPSNTPGGNVDHRACYREIRAELDRRGLLASVEHVAVHPRPHNNPPDNVWTPTNTVTWDEWRWIRDTLAPSAYYWSTEHGYSVGDDQNRDYPRIDLEKWLEYNWELFMRMNPGHPKATEGHMAGVMYWIEALWGHRVSWFKDSLRDAYVPEMPTPSPLWERMQAQVSDLAFLRYGDGEPEPPDPPGEVEDGIDISWYQRAGVDWAAASAAGNKFAILRSSYGLTLDAAVFGHGDQMLYHVPAMLRGYYHYLTAAQNAVTQGRFFAALCRDLPMSLVPAVDIEDEGLTAAKVRDFLTTFEEEWGEAGRIYTRAEYWRRKFGGALDDIAGRWGLWIADHRDRPEPEVPAPWTGWEIWQYGVRGGPEFPAPLDRNRGRVSCPEPPEDPPDEPPEEPPDALKILDASGNLRDWAWLTETFGLTAANIEQGDLWRVTQLQEGGPSASLLVYGPVDTLVTFGWPDGSAQGPVEAKGSIGFGMGSGAYYFPPATGPHWVVVGDCSVDGLGMLGGTEHRHIDVTVSPV
jgi:lysozyme